jgi:hypothetical protein
MLALAYKAGGQEAAPIVARVRRAREENMFFY